MQPESPSETAQKRPPLPSVAVILAVGAVLIGVILALTYAYNRFWHAPEEATVQFGRSMATGIREFFNFTPRVTVNQTVILEAAVPILEVATVSQELSVDHSYQNSQYFSAKSLELRGKFLAKAGFDLSQACDLQVNGRTKKVIARFPEPRVLSVELKEHVIERSESGWWNRLSLEDQKIALEQMQAVARGRAQGLLKEAKANLEVKVRQIAQTNGGTVEFEYVRPKK